MTKFFRKLAKTFAAFYCRLNLLRHLSKKQIILVFSVFAFLLFLYPSDAHAEPVTITGMIIFGLISGAITTAGVLAGKVVGDLIVKPLTFLALVSLGVTLMLLFGAIWLDMGTKMFHWASGQPFSVSMTNPTNNQLIEAGWTVLRDLTNMFFVLGLAYIGLATALNVSGFATKKTFVRFLIFALLINFTPVICGVVVDAANIISQFLLSQIDFTKLSDVYGEAKLGFWSITRETIMNEMTWKQAFSLLLFSFLAGTILWLFALLFLIRHFAIWILVVFSPLAFFCGIFDQTKKYFQKWWHHFTKWSFIAVPAGFFCYLAYLFLVGGLGNRPTLDLKATNIPNDPLGLSAIPEHLVVKPALNFFLGLFPYLIPVIFLCVGFYVTLKINAIGSSIIISSANRLVGGTIKLPKTLALKTGKKAAETARVIATGAVAGGIGGAAGGVAAGRAAAREAGRGGLGQLGGALKQGFFGAVKGVATRKGYEEGIRWYHRGLEKARFKPPGYTEEMEAKRFNVEAQAKRIKDASAERLTEFAERATKFGAMPATISTGIAALKKLAEDKEFNEEKHLPLLLKLKENGINTKAADKAIGQALPHLAADLDQEKFEKRVAKIMILGAPRKITQAQASEEARDELAREQLAKMTKIEIRDNLQLDNIKTFFLFDKSHIEILENATQKRRMDIDRLLDKPENRDKILNRQAQLLEQGRNEDAERLRETIEAIKNSDKFLFGGPGEPKEKTKNLAVDMEIDEARAEAAKAKQEAAEREEKYENKKEGGKA